ncbi:MAG TPA: hypothetical protein VJB18_04715 [Burkholderiales bacterium]|nr:hypothetical protein [Burkholderiales bacterium]
MKRKINVLRAMAAILALTGGISALSPALAADEPQAAPGYLSDGNGNPVSDVTDNCVGDASLPEGQSRKCDGSAPATSVAEPGKAVSGSEA